MAWFKDLAGKAETILNQIDQNAAVAFQNEKKDRLGESATSMWDSQFQSSLQAEPSKTDTYYEVNSVSTIQDNLIGISAGSYEIADTTEDNVEAEDLPEIVTNVPYETTTYAASVKNIDEEMFNDSINVKNSVIDVPQDEQSDLAPEGDLEAPVGMWKKSETDSTENFVQGNSYSTVTRTVLLADNAVLMKELQSAKVDNELLQRKLTAVETDCNEYTDRLASLKQQWDVVVMMLSTMRDINEKMTFLEETLKNIEGVDWHQQQGSLQSIHLNSTDGAIGTTRPLQQELDVNVQMTNDENRSKDQKLLDRLELLLQQFKHISCKLEVLSVAVKKCDSAREEALQLVEIAHRDAVTARQEFDQYKLRAQRILQEKERALARLRGEISDKNPDVTPADDMHYLELQALRHDHEVVCEEVMQLEARLHGMREELSEAERRLASARDTEQQLKETLEMERRARQAAEEDCRVHVEELRAVRKDLFVHQNIFVNKVRDREIELDKLRNQLSQRPVLPSAIDLESRMRNLTQVLVQKQSAVETLTTERNAVQLQLEKLEHKHQELLARVQRTQANFINLNDTDDAKAQVPSFFVESPFDTGVTRRVKRAYSTLDAVSIRTGVFLRRYPLARVLVFFYMILLHIWVMVVLFTYTPTVQGG